MRVVINIINLCSYSDQEQILLVATFRNLPFAMLVDIVRASPFSTHAYRQTDRQTDIHTDRQADRQAGRQADRQTDSD